MAGAGCSKEKSQGFWDAARVVVKREGGSLGVFGVEGAGASLRR